MRCIVDFDQKPKELKMKRPSKTYLQEKTWEQKAQENPLYGVMSHEEFLDSNAEPTEEELKIFYDRGREMVSQWIMPWLQKTKFDSDMRVLEFGCGMGRLTNAIAEQHPPSNVFGIDISKTMVTHAKKNTVDGCTYDAIGDDGKFPYEDESFDRIYSYAVFQHISTKSVVENSIREIARVLKTDGHVKLNFEMLFLPPFENTLRQDTYAFEDTYWRYGWKKVAGIPLWGVKTAKANHWSGVRLGYRQLIKLLQSQNIEVYGITREPGTKKFIWFHGRKLGNL